MKYIFLLFPYFLIVFSCSRTNTEKQIASENSCIDESMYAETIQNHFSNTTFKENIAIVFDNNYKSIGKYDGKSYDSLPKHLQGSDRQAIYNEMDNMGNYLSFVNPKLVDLNIEIINCSEIADTVILFMGAHNTFAIPTRQFDQFDGVLLYNKFKTPLVWRHSIITECSFEKLIEDYFK